jgi:serine/threonine-protein kinase
LRAAGILSDVLAALHHGHRQPQRPLTHGDVRPANVMLSEAGFVKLLNYGFAGYLGHKQAYDELDVRTDLYSAGRLLYELLFGTPPPARLPDHPLGILPELEMLLRKALRPRLNDRYQAAAAMRRDLANVQTQPGR